MTKLSILPRSNPETEADRLMSQLNRLNAEHEVLLRTIADAKATASSSEDEDAVLKAMARQRAAENKAAKIRAEMKRASEALDLAKSEARQKLRSELLAQIGAAAQEFLAAAEVAGAAFRKFVTARDALGRAGFEGDVRAVPVPPAINGGVLLAPALLEQFSKSLRQTQAPRPAVAAQKAAPKPEATPKPAVENPFVHPVGLGPSMPVRGPTPRALLREDAAEGQVLFMIHRAGLELPGRPKLRSGDVVAITSAEAEPYIRKGIGDVVKAADVDMLQKQFNGEASK